MALWPVPSSRRITQGVSRRHNALDIGAPMGSAVVAPVSGRVTRVTRSNRGFGNNIRIVTAQGVEMVFAHLSAFGVRQGQTVRAGQIVGRVGSSGMSTGPHLHFEARRPGPDRFSGTTSTTSAINPLGFLRAARDVIKLARYPASTLGSIAAKQIVRKRTMPRQQQEQHAILSATANQLRRIGQINTFNLGRMIAQGNVQAAQSLGRSLGETAGKIFGPQAIEDITTKVVDSRASRVMFVLGGFTLMLVGLILFGGTFKDDIAEGGAKLAGLAARAAVTGGA